MRRTVTCRDIRGNRTEVSIADLTFRPSIYGVIVRDENVLLHGYEDGWDFPGGGVDLGESFPEAFEREIFEETGMHASPAKLLMFKEDYFIHPGTNRPYHTILFFYSCAQLSGTLSTDHFDDHEKTVARLAEWKPIADILTLKSFSPLSIDERIRIVTMAQEGKGI